MNIVSVLCDDIGIDVSAVNRSNIPVSAMSEIHNIEDLKSAFPQSFDTLGNFRQEYHLTVDPTVAPVVHPCRKYAIQRREAIHDELNKMGVDESDSEGDRAHRLGVKSDLHREARWDPAFVFGPERS